MLDVGDFQLVISCIVITIAYTEKNLQPLTST